MKTSAPSERIAAIVHMRPKLAAQIEGRHMAAIPTPQLVPPVRVGERLLLVEWIGGATGRADLVHVEALYPSTNTPRIWVRRSFCWRQGKHDTDLSQVGLTIDPERAVPLIGDV